MISINKQVACTPPESLAVQVQGKEKGFATAKQSTQLLKLTVVYDSDEGFMAGEHLYIAGESTSTEWAKRPYTIDPAKPFILVPSSAILMLEPADPDGTAAKER